MGARDFEEEVSKYEESMFPLVRSFSELNNSQQFLAIAAIYSKISEYNDNNSENFPYKFDKYGLHDLFKSDTDYELREKLIEVGLEVTEKLMDATIKNIAKSGKYA